ncbi:hypothetical protein LCGC14_2214230 [marine sediment metagenome]|uniref:Uncharacterized protein n=1 Tax=marine sediment metagenome TaxID=412755 RepID=A0A0F9DCT5_9ZZZZ
MTSSSATQLSWETTGLYHGVFTYYFQDSIYSAPDSNGDNVLSMEEQFPQLRSGTISHMLGFGENQRPQKYDGITGQSVLFPSIGKLRFILDRQFLNYSFYVRKHEPYWKDQCLTVARKHNYDYVKGFPNKKVKDFLMQESLYEEISILIN